MVCSRSDLTFCVLIRGAFILLSILTFDVVVFSDLCTSVDPQPYPPEVLSCVWDGSYQRTITCKPGYWASGPDQIEGDTDIDIVGSVRFSGCLGMLRSPILLNTQNSTNVRSILLV